MELKPEIATHNLYDHIIQPYENPMNPDEPSFYYHSDHLGSASFLTDRDGYETQQLVYLPFGEDWVDMKYNTQQYDTPYKFNGKEKDEELRSNREYNNINNKYHEQTGYNNYGARYYYDWASIWLSVDPMSDKYPSTSSYAYCRNNPIMLIDPDGMDDDWYQNSKGHTFWQEGNAPTVNRDGETYNNIGSTYSYKVSNNQTNNYNQNDLESIDYTTGAEFQAQSTGTGCKIAADNMTRSSGANPSSGRAGEILMANHNANGVVTTPTANGAEGVERIKLSIMNGNAITAGVDYKSQQQHNFAPNGDGMTDHFISVVGMNYNLKTGNTTFQFYDPGSSRNGNNSANTMSLQGGFLQGNLSFGKQPTFKVTSVRKNM